MTINDYDIIIEQTAKDLRIKAKGMVQSGWMPLGDITAVHNPKTGVTEYMLQMIKIV